jgi:hypothetical protein
LSTTLINHAAIEILMTGKTTYGIVAITTIVLMFATTIFSAMNSADAQRQIVNQRSIDQSQGNNDQRGLVNVGNTQVGAQVAVPVQACAGVLVGNDACTR